MKYQSNIITHTTDQSHSITHTTHQSYSITHTTHQSHYITHITHHHIITLIQHISHILSLTSHKSNKYMILQTNHLIPAQNIQATLYFQQIYEIDSFVLKCPQSWRVGTILMTVVFMFMCVKLLVIVQLGPNLSWDFGPKVNTKLTLKPPPTHHWKLLEGF